MSARVLPGALALAVLAAAGCGQEDPGVGALRETAATLSDVRSGELDLTLTVVGTDGTGRTGFNVTGPFALADADALPVAELDYTQFAGAEEATVTVVSDGEQAVLVADGTATPLDTDQMAALRSAGGADGNPLEGLDLDAWVTTATSTTEGDTERITADLDVVAVLNDLRGLTGLAGGEGGGPIEGADADRLRNATTTASLDAVTGTEDRLLRSLVIEIQLTGTEQVADLPPGAVLRLELALANHNGEVDVQTPP